MQMIDKAKLITYFSSIQAIQKRYHGRLIPRFAGMCQLTERRSLTIAYVVMFADLVTSEDTR